MQRGTKVLCNGYQGTVVEVCDGQLEGMAVVRLDSGTVCVDIHELVLISLQYKEE